MSEAQVHSNANDRGEPPPRDHSLGYVLLLPDLYGGREILMDDATAARYRAEPAKVFEELVGVPEATHAAWAHFGGCIPCSATTKRGKRCGRWVPFARYDDAKAWGEAYRRGGYCPSHDPR